MTWLDEIWCETETMLIGYPRLHSDIMRMARVIRELATHLRHADRRKSTRLFGSLSPDAKELVNEKNGST